MATPADMAVLEPRVLVVTPEQMLAGMLRRKLEQWRMLFTAAGDIGEAVGILEADPVDVVLVDIRQEREGVANIIATVKRCRPEAETILMNNAGNVAASISGMRAGAADELTVPIEEGSLKEKVFAAWEKAEAARVRQKRRGFFRAFSDAMAAAVFAQAGDIETAERFRDGRMEQDATSSSKEETS